MFSPIKMKPSQKIDGAVATLMALARATASKQRAQFQMISL
jgi:phage terminase large subunit-like protein